jgi:glutathione S-transferase
MKLYFSPGACSLSPHIVLREAGLDFELEKVDLRSKLTASGADYTKINPKGSVPALELDNGYVLTEGPAIVQYLADQAPSAGLAPAAGSLERYQLMSWLNFISSEVHKSFAPLYNPAASADMKDSAIANINKRFGYLNQALAGRDYLMGEGFTVADAYLFVMLHWANKMKMDLAPYPRLQDFYARITARPAVQQALQAESQGAK